MAISVFTALGCIFRCATPLDFCCYMLPSCGRDAHMMYQVRTAGLAVAKGHVPYALFMLLDVLRTFPGQVWKHSLNISEGPMLQPQVNCTCYTLATWFDLRRCQMSQLSSTPATSHASRSTAMCPTPSGVTRTSRWGSVLRALNPRECLLSLQGRCAPRHGSRIKGRCPRR